MYKEVKEKYRALFCRISLRKINFFRTLTTLRRIYVASPASGGGVPLFEKIRCMSCSPYGVWIVTAHSTLIQLWKDSDCLLLFDIAFDHSHKYVFFESFRHEIHRN